MHLSTTAPRRAGSTGPRIVKAALAAGLLTGGLAMNAQAADAHPAHAAGSVKVQHGTLTIKGRPSGDKLALRLRAGAPQTLQVDVNDDGSADFEIARDRFERIVVKAGGGNDTVRIDETNGVFTTTTPTTIDGQRGDDTLLGGSGNETLVGGDGADVVDGNRGADTADLGSGDDRFIWDPGDGSDVVEGQAGHDVMTFNGANIAEEFTVSANGSRVRFFRNVGTINMDLNGIEDIDTNALGGADRLTVDDLSGTDATQLNVDLAGTTANDDGAADQVLVNGTNGNDVIAAAGRAGDVTVTGLAAKVHIVHAQSTQDQLAISGRAGDDVIDGSGLAADAIQFLADGDDGDDVLTGGAGSDTLLGGAGDDVLNGGPAVDVLDGGPGNNVVIQG
jgi:Ca2+-binding RTX toxin-like protein